MGAAGKLTMLLGSALLLAVTFSFRVADADEVLGVPSGLLDVISEDGGCDRVYSDSCMLDPNSKPYREWVRDDSSGDAGFELPTQLDSGGSVMEVIAAHVEAIKDCVAKEHKASNYASGTVKMHWMIESDGRVSGVRVLNPQKRTVEPCLVQVIKAMRFPAHPGPAVPIEFPFKY